MFQYFKFLFFVILLFEVKASAFEVYFSPQTNLDQVIVDEIKKAKKSLDISIYTFRSEPILSALLNKIENNPNFKIRILLRRAGMDHLAEFLAPLEKALNLNGLNSKNLRFVTVTNHHKFFIVDNKILVNTSGNFNDTELAATYDENLFVCSKSCVDLVKAYQAEFNFLFENSNLLILSVGSPNYIPANENAEFGASEDLLAKKIVKSPPNSSMAWFTSANFSPEEKNNRKSFKLKKNLKLGAIEQRLIQKIESAKKSIRVATGHLRSFTLANALALAADRGVDVEVVLDSQEYISSEYQLIEDQEKKDCVNQGKPFEDCVEVGFHFGRWLNEHGVKVYFKYYMVFWDFMNAPQMHHKYMIIDDKVLFTGSYNWSKNAEFKTFENKAIIENVEVVNKYIKNFKLIKNYNRQDFNTFLSGWMNAKDKINLIFEPMSLTVSEIDLFKIYISKKVLRNF